MPAPIYYAHKILEDLAFERKLVLAKPASLDQTPKQVTVKYEHGKPVGSPKSFCRPASRREIKLARRASYRRTYIGKLRS